MPNFGGRSPLASFGNIFDEIASGSLANLQWLGLSGNQIGDAGMTELSRAIASGSLPALQYAFMSGNPGSDAPIKEALARRKQ